jgi:hypothetical protein
MLAQGFSQRQARQNVRNVKTLCVDIRATLLALNRARLSERLQGGAICDG